MGRGGRAMTREDGGKDGGKGTRGDGEAELGSRGLAMGSADGGGQAGSGGGESRERGTAAGGAED
jgi:hypothetical protein